MPTKQEVYDSVENRNYTQKEVKALIHTISNKELSNCVKTIKKGDVFTNVKANKTRPFVVLKVFKERVLAISMSTTEDYMTVIPFSCRIFGDNYFSFNIQLVHVDEVRKNFVGVLEDKKALNDVIRIVKETTIKL